MDRKIINRSIIVLIVLILISALFGFPNYVRYEFEKRFGKPATFFYGVNVGVMLKDDNFYSDEYYLDDTKSANMEASKYNDDFDVYIYGKFVNSSDNLVVLVNDNIIYNKDAIKDGGNLFSRYYIQKRFVIKLTNYIKSGHNKIMISTGNATEIFDINAT